MFKAAYVRGIQNALIQSGHVAFPDEDSAAKVADYIAGHMTFEPLNGAVPREVTAKIAEHIITAWAHYKEQPGFKAASVMKLSSVDDLAKLAERHALDVMQKAAEGSTIEGGDKGNKEPSSSEAKMDLTTAYRPHGYAEDSRGKTDVDTRPGAVGKEEEHPKKPSESPAGTNSVEEQTHTASLNDLLKKLAEGSTILGGDKGNKEPTTGEGKMDLAARPHGYAGLPGQGALGEMMKHFGGAAAVGKETAHPNAPAQSPSGTNSVVQTSAKSAEDAAYMLVFKKTAAEILPHLSTALSDDAKVAHVRTCMGLTTEEKAHYLIGLQKTAADKTTPNLPPGSRADGYAGHTPDATHARPGAYDGRSANQGTSKQAEMPDFIREKMDEKKDEKKDGDGEKKDDGFGGKKAPPFGAKADDEKKDEKKDDEKKEGSLLDVIRRISSTVQPSA